MASWPPLSQKINYLLASQSIVWYLLCEITDIDTSGTDTDINTGIGPSLIIVCWPVSQLLKGLYTIGNIWDIFTRPSTPVRGRVKGKTGQYGSYSLGNN